MPTFSDGATEETIRERSEMLNLFYTLCTAERIS